MLDDDTIIYTSGISYKIHNVQSGKMKLFFSRDGGGIGSIAVDKQQKYFAVAEKGSFPNIYIFEYPSLRLYRILRGGTEKSYSNVSFSLRGEKLASVGSEPDFNICIWDWRNEILVLKAKAFSQEVFRVIFSDHSDTILSTSGLAHLRFWKIAGTFTGLKLKGQTGKFGSVELSDITGFYILPDGKVVSGSENGRLLLWEGNLIKAVLCISEEKGCHEGVINTIQKVGNHIISAGRDGFVRYWNYEEIDNMEANDQLLGFLKPEREFMIVTNPEDPPESHRPADIYEIVVYKGYWLIHDAMGKVFKVTINPDSITQQELLSFNSGKITGISNSRESNALASIGQDGAVRLLDIVNRKEYYTRGFLGRGTCIDWLRLTNNHKDRFVAAGYDNGIVRIVHFSKEKMYLRKAMKVHNNPVKSLSFSPSGDCLAVLSANGEIFFFSVSPDEEQPGDIRVDPICIYPVQKKIKSMVWAQTISRLLLGCETGEVIEVEVPRAFRAGDEELRPEDQGFDSTQTYLNEHVRTRTFTIRMMEFQKPKINENDLNFLLEDKVIEKFVEWDPAPISALTYLDESKGEFICGVEGPYLGYLYICRFGEDKPVEAVQTNKSVTRYLAKAGDNQFLVSGTENGEVFVRLINNLHVYSKLQNHDQNFGKIVGVLMNYDKTALTSASEDATIITKTIDLSYFAQVANLRTQQKVEREKKKARKLEAEENGEDEEEEEEDEEEDSQGEIIYKTDSYDVAISNLPVKPPQLTGGIEDEFFFDDVPNRVDSPDILDPNMYSIQEEKLNAEEDKRRSEAEKRKQQMRDQIQALRDRFKSLKQYDSSLEEFLRLSFEDFNIDPEYYKMLQDRVADMLDEANKEVSFSVEFGKLKTKKLKDFFMSELEYDRTSVKAFKTPLVVTTFRVKKPTAFISNQWKDREVAKPGEDKKHTESQKLEDKAGKDNEVVKSTNLIDDWLQKNSNVVIDQNYLKERKVTLKLNQSSSSVEKFTRAKMKHDKDIRSQMKQELLERQPPEKVSKESPEVKEAENNMGNYKLKSDPTYEVPPQDRLSVQKQRKMIFILEEIIYSMKSQFNSDLLVLKDRKKKLFEKIINSNKRVAQINKDIEKNKLAKQSLQDLQINDVLFNPQYEYHLEFPEKLLEVTKEEIDELAKQKEEERLRKKQGRFANAAEEPTPAEEEKTEQSAEPEKEQRVEIQFMRRTKMKAQNSEREEYLKQMNQLRLRSEKKLLLDEIESEVQTFDEDLSEESNRKIMLEYEMKFYQMKLITSYQELIILDAFEKKDEILYAEHARIHTKHLENIDNISRNQLQIKERTENKKAFEARCKDAEAKFNEKVPNKEIANKAYELYKQSQKKNRGGHGDDGEDGEGGMEEDDELAHKDVGAEIKALLKEWQSEFPNASYVRDRHEAERLRDECIATISQLNSAQMGFEEERKKSAEQLTISRDKIKAIQKEKLEKVSTLYVSYFLRLDQVQNLFDFRGIVKIPPRLDKSLLFTQQGLLNLHNNLKKLGEDATRIEQQSKVLHSKQNTLEREKAILDKAHKEALAECEEIYQLKFGERIPQEVLDGLEPTPKLKALQKEFEKEEKLSIRRIEEANQLLKATKKELLEIKQKNTQIIKFITDTGNEQLSLNKNLDSTNNNITKEEKDNKKNDLMTFRKNLMEIIKLLNQQIEGVRYEISIFKQKGGKIANIMGEEARVPDEESQPDM
jgi:WD40 repeat protein